MATTDFNLTAAQLVEDALKLNGLLVEDQPLESTALQNGLTSLNLMVKTWQAQGLHLWSKTEGILFIRPGETQYFLGEAGDQATNFDDFIGTELTADALITATTLVVTDTTGMTALDKIGIQLNNGTRQWTTIISVDSPTGLTITDSLLDAADSTNTVFTYTTQIQRPLRILGMRRGNIGSNTEVPVDPFDSRSQYFNQSNKESQGTINQYYYTPELGNGRVYLWQTGQSVNDFIRFTFERPLNDFDDNDDPADFPVEWTETLLYNLSKREGIRGNVPQQRLANIAAEARFLLDQALGFDTDPLFLQVQPEL